MVIMPNGLRKILSSGLSIVAAVVGLLFFGASALANPCDSPNASWNQNLTPAFSCHCIDDKDGSRDRQSYVVIKSGMALCADACGTTCQDSGLSDVRPLHCRCVRPADCETALNGKCYENNKDADGNPPPAGWIKALYRCPKDNDNICYVPPRTRAPQQVNLPAAEDEASPAAPAAPSTVTLKISDCCRQIVPKINDQAEDYTLNHLVQTGINIYECILCLVGALILVMLIFGAILIMVSAGNDQRVAAGKNIITAAVVGGIIVFFSFLIVNFTVKALGGQFNNQDRVEIKVQGQ